MTKQAASSERSFFFKQPGNFTLGTRTADVTAAPEQQARIRHESSELSATDISKKKLEPICIRVPPNDTIFEKVHLKEIAWRSVIDRASFGVIRDQSSA